MLEGMQTLQFRTPSFSTAWRGSPELSVTVQCRDGQSVFKNTCVRARMYAYIYMHVCVCTCICLHVCFYFFPVAVVKHLPKAAQEGCGKSSFDIRLSTEMRGKLACLAS